MRFHSVLTPEFAACALRAAGFDFAPEVLRVESRDCRWAVYLPDWRLAWFAASAEGVELLARERRVLQLLLARCSFGAPRVLYASSDEDFDVRALVPGSNDSLRLYHDVKRRPELGTRVGAAIGGMLVEQHTKILAPDAARWLPARASWPLPSATNRGPRRSVGSLKTPIQPAAVAKSVTRVVPVAILASRARGRVTAAAVALATADLDVRAPGRLWMKGHNRTRSGFETS
jgi:hypothetical protein